MQYLVNVGYGEERDETIKWFQANGYTGHLPDDYPHGVIVVEDERFFGGNVTCFAASVSCGKKPISWEDWRKCICK